MKFTTITATAALATLASAAPEAAPKLFNIQAQTTDNRFNGQCIVSYHTGAGTGDAVLVPCTEKTKEFYMKGTSIAWTGFGSDVPAGFQSVAGASYDDWYPATVSAGDGTSGMHYNATAGFISPQNTGYLACRWSHAGAPQIFTKAYNNNVIVLANCANVKLVKQF